jgi:hypothetical protein
LMKINHLNHQSKNRFRIFSYKWKIFLACHQIHTKMTLNDDCTKMIYREKKTRKLHFDQVLDLDSSFSSNYRRLRSENRFRIFSYRWKFFFACHQIHTKMTLNADRRYYRDEVMIEIENLMKIKSVKHASQSSDSRYSYAYTWNTEYWWSWKTYMYESILLLKFQANKWWFREMMMIE